LSATTAQAATTTVSLPITQYSHMLVDAAHKHLFITSGSGSSSILVTDYAGQTVATIPNEPGATGLALSGDGSTVYAALTNGDAISAISTSSLAETARYGTGAGTDPTYVAYTSGKIWFGYGAAAQGGIGSIDPGTSPATVTLNAVNAPINSWYAAPMLSATPSGVLVAGEPGQSPVQMASYDVSSGTATVLAPEKLFISPEADNLGSMQVTPDGKDVVVASGYPYYHQVYKTSDRSADGAYPTTNYPNSVSISSDGTVAAGTDAGSNEVFVFAPGGSTRWLATTSGRTGWRPTGSRSRQTRACCSPSPWRAATEVPPR
jgi:DNA-binding beta-propeller fold protein YncE